MEVRFPLRDPLKRSLFVVQRRYRSGNLATERVCYPNAPGVHFSQYVNTLHPLEHDLRIAMNKMERARLLGKVHLNGVPLLDFLDPSRDPSLASALYTNTRLGGKKENSIHPQFFITVSRILGQHSVSLFPNLDSVELAFLGCHSISRALRVSAVSADDLGTDFQRFRDHRDETKQISILHRLGVLMVTTGGALTLQQETLALPSQGDLFGG